jgi:hypothetical protein
VRLYSRPGNDLTKRFPLLAETLAQLRCKSCVIDGEAVACGADGRSTFDFIRYRHHDEVVFLYAFDLLRLGVDDLLNRFFVFKKGGWGWPRACQSQTPSDLVSSMMPTSLAIATVNVTKVSAVDWAGH